MHPTHQTSAELWPSRRLTHSAHDRPAARAPLRSAQRSAGTSTSRRVASSGSSGRHSASSRIAGREVVEQAAQPALAVADEAPSDVGRGSGPDGHRQRRDGAARPERDRADRRIRGSEGSDQERQHVWSEVRHVATGHEHERLIDHLETGQQPDQRAAMGLGIGDEPDGSADVGHRPLGARGKHDDDLGNDGRDARDGPIEEARSVEVRRQLVGPESARAAAGEDDPADPVVRSRSARHADHEAVTELIPARSQVRRRPADRARGRSASGAGSPADRGPRGSPSRISGSFRSHRGRRPG